MRNESTVTLTAEEVMSGEKDYLILAAKDGYNDMLRGMGFRAEYERAPMWYQINYERGRMWVVSYRAANMKPPQWRVSSLLPARIPKEVPRILAMGNSNSIPE